MNHEAEEEAIARVNDGYSHTHITFIHPFFALGSQNGKIEPPPPTKMMTLRVPHDQDRCHHHPTQCLLLSLDNPNLCVSVHTSV